MSDESIDQAEKIPDISPPQKKIEKVERPWLIIMMSGQAVQITTIEYNRIRKASEDRVILVNLDNGELLNIRNIDMVRSKESFEAQMKHEMAMMKKQEEEANRRKNSGILVPR